MKIISINNTVLNVSKICLGVADIGVKMAENESHTLLDTFVDQGGNFIDTARIYSDWIPGELHRSERILGDWLRNHKGRDKLIVATKGAHPELSSMNVSRMSNKDITTDIDGSLKSMRTDYIDLYWLHRDDPDKPVIEILETLNDNVKQGKIRYFGCSNWTVERTKEALSVAKAKNMGSFVASQVLWNIGCYGMKPPGDPTLVTFDKNMFQLHKETGIAAIPYSSQANGFFSYLDKNDPMSKEKVKNSGYFTERNLKLFSLMKDTSNALGISITDLVLAYLLSQPIQVFPIVGCRSVKQLMESIKAADVRLPQEQLQQIEVSIVSA